MRDIVRSKTERELVRVKIHDENAFWNEVGVNAGVSKLMLLNLNLLLPVLVYAARHSLTAVRHKLNLMLPVQVNAVEGDFINTSIKGFVASDIMRSGTTSLEAENGQHADKYRKLKEVYEWKNVELKEENEKKLELMRKEFVNERANLVEDTMRKILEKLPPEVARMVIT
ncbi:hypothetical protein Tco_0938046 [Tanacetum coccineum]|uniref:Uncharacterized protein n=1 Tax=Tanacetum coccineum TaxID=301880 RepID=A0ABQ5DG03_9ASTR